MKFAFGTGLNPLNPFEIVEHAKLCEAAGFDMVMSGDNPTSVGEHFMALTMIALNTSRVKVGSFISNTVTRHPAVVACGLTTLDALAPGRAYMGLSSGDTAAVNLGLKPGSIAQMEEFIRCVQDLHLRGEGSYNAKPVKFSFSGRRLPIFMACGGPRSLRLAGRLADGIFVETGLLPELIEDAKKHIAAGAAEAGRSMDDIELWWHARAALGADREDAIDNVSSAIAGIGKRLARNGREGKFIPDDLWPKIQELEANYDYAGHTEIKTAPGAASGKPMSNAHLLETYGLRDYFADRFAIVGNVEDYKRRLSELRDQGVHNIAVAAMMPDRPNWIETMGKQVIPHFA